MHYLTIFLSKILATGFLTLVIAIILLLYLNRYLKIKKLFGLQKYKNYLLIGGIICVLIIFFAGQAVNSFVSFDYFMQTQGPGIGPQISVANAVKFLANIDKFRVVDDIARSPNDVPQIEEDSYRTDDEKDDKNINENKQKQVYYAITTEEVINEIAPGIFINSWTFDGTIPGKFMRAKIGDNVTISIKNKETSLHTHSIDLHAVTGQGGGAAVTQVKPGEEKTFSFKALNPGLYVYHCATPNVGVHTAHGMYGLILIEPEEGFEKVDREFYIMQGEFYTQGSIGNRGLQVFDVNKYLLGDPTYIFFNGRKEAINGKMKAKVGDKIRLYVGNGGVNLVSSFHVIGEIFDKVYPEGGFPAQRDIQTTVIPAGGASIVEFTVDLPGRYILVDHSLARLDKGVWGIIEVEGEWNNTIYSPQPGSEKGKSDDKSSH